MSPCQSVRLTKTTTSNGSFFLTMLLYQRTGKQSCQNCTSGPNPLNIFCVGGIWDSGRLAYIAGRVQSVLNKFQLWQAYSHWFHNCWQLSVGWDQATRWLESRVSKAEKLLKKGKGKERSALAWHMKWISKKAGS